MQKLARKVAKILREGGVENYDQTKHIFKLIRNELELKPTRRRTSGTAKRISKSEVDTLLTAAYEKSSEVGLMVQVLYETALRVSEFVNLEIEDVYTDELRIIVKHGKGDKRREVPITDHLARSIQLYVGARNSGPVFRSSRGKRFTTRRIQQLVAEVATSAGIQQQVTPHTLRHTRATLLAEAGMHKDLLQVFLGHEKPETTQIYTNTAALQVNKGFRQATVQG